MLGQPAWPAADNPPTPWRSVRAIMLCGQCVAVGDVAVLRVRANNNNTVAAASQSPSCWPRPQRAQDGLGAREREPVERGEQRRGD